MQNQEFKNPEYSAPVLKENVEITRWQPTPNDPPWGILAALGILTASILFIIIFPPFFVMPYLFRQQIPLSDQTEVLKFMQTDPTAVVLQLLAIIPAHLLTLVLAWLVVTGLKKYSFRQTLGWDWGGYRIWHNIPILIFFFILAAILSSLLGSQENDMDKILKSSRYAVFLVAFFATFTAPLVEEVVYRGILYSALQKKLGVALAVIGVTVVFAAIHVPQYSSNGTPDYATISMLLLLSLVLTLIRVKTGNLLPCVVLHTVFNGVQSVLLLLQPYLPVDPKIDSEQINTVLQILG